MRDKYLMVIGCQKKKLEKIDKKIARNILDYIHCNQYEYTGIISVIRRPMAGDKNFRRSGDDIAIDTKEYLDYPSSVVIEVPGYSIDCDNFRKDVHYDIIGISTSASVMCMAMNMYSCGHDISVLEKYCEDRKGKKLEEHAFNIMNAYMPGVVK